MPARSRAAAHAGQGRPRQQRPAPSTIVDLGGGDDVYVGRGTGYADSVDGGGGADKLTSSRADDTFIGGGAKDTFIFAANGGSDAIRDFGGRDKIDLSALGLTGFGSSATASRT